MKMEELKFSHNEKKLVLQMARSLFPEFKHITLDNDKIRFSNVEMNSLSNFVFKIANVKNDVKINIFELLVLHFPKRLSIMKSGNLSFTAIYVAHLTYLFNIKPNAIVNYLYSVYTSIKTPYNIDGVVNNVIRGLRKYEEDDLIPDVEFSKMMSHVKILHSSNNVSPDRYRELIRDFDKLIKIS